MKYLCTLLTGLLFFLSAVNLLAQEEIFAPQVGRPVKLEASGAGDAPLKPEIATPPAETDIEAPELLPPDEALAREKLADQLLVKKSPLAVDMLISVINSRMLEHKLELYDPSLLPLHLKLAESYLQSGQEDAAIETLDPILTLEKLPTSIDPILFYSILGEAQYKDGQHGRADASWQMALAAIKDKKDAALGGKALELSINIAKNFLKQKGRVPEEAEIELLAALNTWDKKAKQYYQSAFIYLELARLTKSMGRSKDAANYYKKAATAANVFLKENKNPTAMERLLATIQKESGAKPKGRKGRKEAAAATPGPATLPDFEKLEMEFSGYERLGQLDHFEPLITESIAQTKKDYGAESPFYGLVMGIWLRYLNEKGDVLRLAADLDQSAETPWGFTEMEKATTRTRLFNQFYSLNLPERLLTEYNIEYNQGLADFLTKTQEEPVK